MSFECYLCNYQTSQIKDICYHLRNKHMLFDSCNLNLKCCAGCPAVFRTFNGFIKHLKKCILQKDDVPSTSNDYKESDLKDDFSYYSINNEKIKLNESNTEDNHTIQQNVSNCNGLIFCRFARSCCNKYS